eukprot:TRINITY_DN1451_c0_g1_i1.p1 TRINITY_DN1451_c0_g1~~TRINITY_DN1451_c0_g1_i1.p1  ORF type:complete len:823 (+),score=360.46 TRINITY_DN1451_c0_g1_i1:122-2590(+)
MSEVVDMEAMFHELKDLIARDKPSCIFAYVSEYAKNRANINALPETDRAMLLCDAACTGNLKELENLLDKGLDPNTSDYDKRSALHLAADNGELDCARLLIARGATVDSLDRWGNTPYSGAVQRGHDGVATFLKEKGAKARKLQSTDDGATLLCAAAGAGNLAKLKDLIEGGISPSVTDYDDRGAIHLASEEGHLDIVKYLVDKGVEVNLQDRWGTTPLTGAENSDQSEIAHFLRTRGGKRTGEMALKRKSSFSLQGTQNELIKAAASGDVNEIERLIQNGADPNQGDYDHRYPLHLAAEEGHMEAVMLLVECHALLDVKDRWGTTPLRGAIRNTHNDIADYLKDQGALTDKFQEPRSYQSNVRTTRNFFEAIANSVAFPKSEVLPVTALAMRLNTEYGLLVSDHPVLFRELQHLSRKMDDPLVCEFLEANPQAKDALQDFHTPSWSEGDLAGKVFLYADLSDLVLHVHAEHDAVGSLTVPETMTLLSEVVLDKLAIHNWDAFQTNLRQIYEEVLQSSNEGANADYIPELRDAPSDRFAVSVCTIHGQRLNFGDTSGTFSVQSVGKTFAYTRALRLHGHDYVHKHVGQEPSGRAFNDFALTRQGTPFNPVTNAGAIVTCSMLDADIDDVEERLQPYKTFLSEMSGGMAVGDCMDVYRSEQECAFRNYALANFMKAEDTFPENIDTHEKLSSAVEFYLRVCSSKVSAPLLANIAGTYANYGQSPLTGESLMTESEVKQTLQILSSCGMYDYSGEWACTIGMPAKSGVSGEIFVVVPGVLGMCVWSPKLDQIGNSVRGIRLCEKFAKKFRFSVLDLLFRAKDSS